MQLNPFKWFERKDVALNDPHLVEILGLPSGSIGAAQALRCPAVQCAVRAIAETIGSLPVHTYVRDARGTKKRDTRHVAEPLVATEANPWTSAGALRQQLVVDALLEGNGYGAVIKADNKPREIHHLAPSSTRIDMGSGEPVYIYTDAKGERRYSYEDVIHIAAPITRDGIYGIAPTQLASNAIRFALELEQHGVKLFRNAARPGGVLKCKGKMADTALARLKASWQAMYAGTENTGSTPILEDGLEWEQIQLTSVDSQFLELRGFAVAEIARAFRVPPIFLQDYGRATWGNSAEMGQQFLTFSLMPWIKTFEFAYARALLSKEERSTHYFEFITDDLVRADISKRMTAYRQAIDGGFLTPNEARASENRPALPGGDELRPAPKASPIAANDNTSNQQDQAA